MPTAATIVTVANAAPADAGALVAHNLALLRARGGRKVLLLDAGRGQSGAGRGVVARTVSQNGLSTELEGLQARYDDVVILIDTDGGDGVDSRCALIAAQVALVPLAPDRADVDTHYGLIARLNSARMFNPGLRVLFVTAGGERDPAPRDLCAMRAYAAQVMSAGLAATILHLPALRWGAGAIDNCTGAADMAALYEEVYPAAGAVPPAAGQFLQKQGTE